MSTLLSRMSPRKNLRLGVVAFIPVLILALTSAGALAATQSFTNNTTITIPAVSNLAGPASPYPSAIMVAGVTGTITDVNVTLNGVSHTRPDDLDIVLVGPLGDKLMLVSDACGGTAVTGLIWVFDDEAGGTLPDSDTGGACTSGTYTPVDYNAGEALPAPAPAGPYGLSLAVFDGQDPNGTWNLYVADDRDSYVGQIASGWSLTIESTDPEPEPPGGDGEQPAPTGPVVTAADIARSQAPLCADLSGETNPVVRATILDGTVTNGNVYCRVLAENGEFVTAGGAAAVGNQDLLNLGVWQAVDVFGMAGSQGVAAFNHPVTVCLQGTGRLFYLDATTAPRVLVGVAASAQGGYTCGAILNAGTVVLTP